MQTDDDISFWSGIISRSPQSCNLKAHLWDEHTIWDLSQLGLQIAVNKVLLSAVQIWM